ncbi:MAG: PQQ-binding-like beta-propeller repeat protein [Dehalococcoidia bacterium]
MRLKNGVAFAGLTLLAFLFAGCQLFQDETEPTPPGQQPTSPAEVPAVPPEVAAAAHEWPMGNRDYSNTRATMDAQIDSTNVHELGMAWTMPLTAASDWGTAASTPLIANGIVYFQDLMTNVSALDLETGNIIWQQNYNRAALGPNGPAIGWGKVFIQDGINNFIALDIDNGEELWSTQLEPSTGTQQPYVYGGYVYTGTGAGKPVEGPEHSGGRQSYVGGTSGIVYGLDQETGGIIWNFQVVEEGFWGDPDTNGGGALWYPPGIDTDTGLTFWGTGNPAPFPGTVEQPNASSRPGPNLYSNTMLAIDGSTGELVWHNQVKSHDLFDLDFQGSPVLATALIDGQERDVVMGWGKLGIVYAFDRQTGEIVWQTPVGEHQNDELQEIPPGEEILVIPGVWGGVETPVALADSVLYVLTNNLGSPYTATGFDSENAAEAVTSSEGRTNLQDGEGVFVAIDINTGDILWERHFETPAFGGATVVNDLVFTATLGGTIHALSREDGSTVWSMQAPGGIIAWPAVAEDTIVWPAGLGREPTLFALRLGAEGDIVPPAAQAEPTEAP